MDLFPPEDEEGGDAYNIHGPSFTPSLLADGNWETIGSIGNEVDLGPQTSYGQNTTTSQPQDNIDHQLFEQRSTTHSRHNSPFTRPAAPLVSELGPLPFSQPNRGISTNQLRSLPTPRAPRASSSSLDTSVHPQSLHGQYPQSQPQPVLPPAILGYENLPQGLATSGVGAFPIPAVFAGYGGFDQEASTQNPSSFPNSYTPIHYHNNILNAFADPSVPLRVLDEFLNPFPDELVAILNREFTSHSLGYIDHELERVQRTRQEAGRNQSQPPTTAVIYSSGRRLSQHGPDHSMLKVRYATESRDLERGRKPAIPERTPRRSRSGTTTPGTTTPGRRTPSNRRANIQQIVANKYHVYKPLPLPPSSWVAQPPGRPSTRFEYTGYGELLPLRRFNDQELNDFIQYHPGHQWRPVDQTQEKSSLIIWIQNTPADSKLRYPDRDHSSRCRFASCPTKGGTIRTGEFRVCFDEQPGARWEGVVTDPFHNAGYAHLYCMEKNFNFHKIYHDYRVEPDTRRLPEGGVNRMAVNRDHQSILEVIEEYKNRDPQIIRDALQLDDDDWFKFTLTYALTLHHRNSIANHAKATRNERKGFSINAHMGDLNRRAEFNTLSPRVKRTFLNDLYKNPEVIDKIGTYVSTMEEGEKGVEDDEDDEDEDDEGKGEEEEAPQVERKRKRQRKA